MERIIQPLVLINKTETLREASRSLTSIRGKVLVDDLMKIKGVGPYIASSGAIHSTGRRLALPDPNSIRVYPRVFGLRSDPSRPSTDPRLWEDALQVLPKTRVSDYAYAVLDLGALVCRNSNPSCSDCPMYLAVCKGVEPD